MKIAITIALVCLMGTLLKAQFLEPQVDSIPMRDGKQLAADIYIPDTLSGNTYSTILIQTPYNRLYYRWLGLPLGIGMSVDSSRYAIVIVDWRCFYGSIDACIANPDRGKDGYDVIDWIIGQSWSNGKVGTWGPSALGKIQYMTAREHHPAHLCAAPLVAAPQYDYHEYYPGGALRTEYIEQLDNLGFGLGAFVYGHPVYDLTWMYAEDITFYPEEIDIPTFMIGGWYDHNIKLMIDFYNALQDSSIISNHYLLFGPWAHGSVGKAQQGELVYHEAKGWADSLTRLFFDYYLDEIQNGWEQGDLITYFEMGNNQWHTASGWPPSNVSIQEFYLHPDYSIQNYPPSGGLSSHEFIYDPKDPSPTIGGATLRLDLLQGPYDQAPLVEARNDILIYAAGLLESPLSLAGKVIVQLSVSSDKKDTDFVVRLTDVYPDNRSMLLFSGIQRMRFSNGYTASDTSLINPGAIYSIEIELPDQAITFMPGHRLRIDITSANYPRFDCNLNNGGPLYSAGDTISAVNKVYFNAQTPSLIKLPVIDHTSAVSPLKSYKKYLQIFPNPILGSASLIFSPPMDDNCIVKIVDITGKTVLILFSGRVYKESLILNLNTENLPSGLMFIVIEGKRFHHTEKIILL